MPIDTDVTDQISFEVIDPVDVAPPGSVFEAYIEEGLEQLPLGDQVVDITFNTEKASLEYLFDEKLIYNTVDASPIVIGYEFTDFSTTGFQITLSATPDTGNYYFKWKVRIPTTIVEGNVVPAIVSGNGTGTVSKVTVVSSDGITGSVSNATTMPTIALGLSDGQIPLTKLAETVVTGPVLTPSGAATVTNKTIDGNFNTITNLPMSALEGPGIITDQLDDPNRFTGLIWDNTNKTFDWVGTPTVRGMQKEVWVSTRTDGKAGIGTTDDPFDAGIAAGEDENDAAAKLTALWTTYQPNYIFRYVGDKNTIYYTYGFGSGRGGSTLRTTAGTNCKHYGNATIRLIGAAHGADDGVIFGADYNIRSDGFEVHGLHLDCNGNAQPGWATGANIRAFYVRGSDIVLKPSEITGFGTSAAGTENFAVMVAAETDAGTYSRNIFADCYMHSPATGNADGCSTVLIANIAAGAVGTDCEVNDVIVDLTGNDFTYSHGPSAESLKNVTAIGCSEGLYFEPSGTTGSTYVRNCTYRDCTFPIHSSAHIGSTVPRIYIQDTTSIDCGGVIFEADDGLTHYFDVIFDNFKWIKSDGTLSTGGAMALSNIVKATITNCKLDSSYATVIDLHATTPFVAENRTTAGALVTYKLNGSTAVQSCTVGVPTLTGGQGFRMNSGNTAFEAFTPIGNPIGNSLTIQKDQNAVTQLLIKNATAGTGANARLFLENDAGKVFSVQLFSSAATPYGAIAAGMASLDTDSPGGLVLMAEDAAAIIKIAVGGSTEKARFSASGGLSLGSTTDAGAGSLLLGGDLVFGTGTGTKIGTATNQKLALWNTAPTAQPTTAVGAATLVGGGGTALTDTDTFDGYTLKQVVKALRNIGAIA